MFRPALILACLAALLQLCWPAAHGLHEQVADEVGQIAHAHSDHDHAHQDHQDRDRPQPQHRHDASHCAACHAITSLRAPGTFAPPMALVTITHAEPRIVEARTLPSHTPVDLTAAAPRGPPDFC